MMELTARSRIVAPKQQGVALAMALVILIILTILGISAMKTTTLELKMATGIQDNTAVFQAAESGLAEAFKATVLDPNQTNTSYYSPDSRIYVKTDTDPAGTSQAPNSTKPSGKTQQGTQYANYKQVSTAKSPGGAKVTIHQGVRIEVHANN